MARENVDLYQIGKTPDELQAALILLRQEFDAHNHNGTSSRSFETIIAETVSARTMLIRKTSYADTASGIWMGEVDGLMKLKLGTASSYLQWDGTALSIAGSITATSGTIGGWTIGSSTLSGGGVTLSSTGTITGGVIRTSSTGARVQMNDSTDALEVYDSGSTKRMTLDNDEITFFDSSGNERGGIYASATTTLYFHALNGGNIIIEAEGALYGVLMYANGGQVAAFTTAGLGMSNDITMNNNDIMTCGNIEAYDATSDIGTTTTPFDNLYVKDIYLTPQAAGPASDGQIRYYSDAGVYEIRVELNGADYRFVLETPP